MLALPWCLHAYAFVIRKCVGKETSNFRPGHFGIDSYAVESFFIICPYSIWSGSDSKDRQQGPRWNSRGAMWLHGPLGREGPWDLSRQCTPQNVPTSGNGTPERSEPPDRSEALIPNLRNSHVVLILAILILKG